jgi:hypothetical protein
VSEDIAFEVLERGPSCGCATERFVDQHVTVGEERPPAHAPRVGSIGSRAITID